MGLLGAERPGLAGLFREMYSRAGVCPSDFFTEFGDAAYINMGIMGLLATAVMLALGVDINGATAGGLFTMIGYSGFGKHPKNAAPVLLGAIAPSYVNMWPPTDPVNVLAIIFSTGLAPIAGSFGWKWGVLAGFIHVNIVHNAAYLNNGLNLCNNGFAAGLVAVFMVSLLTAVRGLGAGEDGAVQGALTFLR